MDGRANGRVPSYVFLFIIIIDVDRQMGLCMKARDDRCNRG